MEFCPGAKAIRQPKPEIFDCPECGGEIEIWTDEIKGECSACGHRMYRDGMMSCLEWCEYGEQCVGEAAYNRFLEGKAAGVKRKLMELLERRLEHSPRLLDHARARLHQVEELASGKKGETHLVVPAALAWFLPGDRHSVERDLVRCGLAPEHAGRVAGLVEKIRGSAPDMAEKSDKAENPEKVQKPEEAEKNEYAGDEPENLVLLRRVLAPGEESS